ncbi:MAG: S8 family serine peptidase, partial [Bacteroidetes bacterium]|nr:S8 family serine peptidase [Bacteroidota bacterium]
MKRVRIIALALITGLFVNSYAQKPGEKAPEGWQHLDPKLNKVYGVSSNEAYEKLLKGKQGKTIIVAVIDGGTDIYHEDLKDNLWVNEKEIPNNGIDDDKNGYVDDIHGWNFIGGKDGTNVEHDTYEFTRLYGKWKKKYDDIDPTKVLEADKKEYQIWLKVKEKFELELATSKAVLDNIQSMTRGMESILRRLKTRDPKMEDVLALPATSKDDLNGKRIVIGAIKNGESMESVSKQLESYKEHYSKEVDYYLNVNYNSRTIVGDTYEAANQRNYGNKDVKGPDASHGSHVAGIIGAVRNNNLGIQGIALNVKIMVIRVVPDGDERDKDVANGILYAAQNGASIINMSFGKNFGYNKKTVDDAVKFAMSKDVLMIHAAGNNGECNDSIAHYPTREYEDDSTFAKSWIEVGASTWMAKKLLPASFSNFGMKSVDVFAPGYDINSTVPDSNEYKEESGTSMAAPVTAGVAAVVRSYYPDLSAVQVKEAIEKSVVVVKGKVLLPGSGKKKTKVKFKKLCKSGGIV